MVDISIPRILGKLDNYFETNDYDGAEKHLIHWFEEARNAHNQKLELLMSNELIGLYLKLNRETECMQTVRHALSLVHTMKIAEDIGAGTTYLNCATAYQAFSRPDNALHLFEKALNVYEKSLPESDQRRGGLYNNMALTLVSLKRYLEAYHYYAKAIEIMGEQELWLEVAMTYLNIANAKEAEYGLVEAESAIDYLLNKAAELIDAYDDRRGYYAFVCEKCASVYGYYGRFVYKDTLLKRAEDIYAGN